MTTLLEQIKARTSELATTKRSSFNTNDFLLEILLDKKIKRSDVIDLIIAKRLELNEVGVETKDFDTIVEKMYKTSKNGLDTSVSDSQNNSSFSYNEKYSGYTLSKQGNVLSISKAKVKNV